MSQLLDQVRSCIRLRHYSIRTEEAYLSWIKRYILYHDKRHPLDLGQLEVSAFLTHLAVDLNVAPSTQNQALSALLFLYREVLNLPLTIISEVQRAKRVERLPVVFTKAEVQTVIALLRDEMWLMVLIP
jgi:integrase